MNWPGWTLALCLLNGGTLWMSAQDESIVPIEVKVGREETDLGVRNHIDTYIQSVRERIDLDIGKPIRLHVEVENVNGAAPDVFDTFPRRLVFHQEAMRVEILLDADWRRHREALARTISVGLLQAVAWGGNDEAQLAELPAPPLWLSEGLTQWALRDTRDKVRSRVVLPTIRVQDVSPLAEDLRQIVWKAVRTDHVPSLETIQGWKNLSGLRAEKFWQKAFCYWVFNGATGNESGRQAVREWLHSQDLIEPEPYWSLTEQEQVWWRRQAQSSEKSAAYQLTWERSAQELRELLHFEHTVDRQSPSQLVSIANLPQKGKETVGLGQKLLEQTEALRNLAARAHPLAGPVIQAYVAAALNWIEGDYAAYEASRSEASARMERAGLYFERTSERLNWVMVNFDVEGLSDEQADHATLLRELSKERSRVRREAQAKFSVQSGEKIQ